MGNPQPSSKLKIMGYIYKITSPSGKSYIGQTIRPPEERFREHAKCLGSCVLLENAIRKYTWDAMIVEILMEVNEQFLDSYETRCIDMFYTLEPNGYNIRTGGSVAKHSEASRERMRVAKLGPKNHNYGKPRTDTAKVAISRKKAGEKHHFYGKTLTDEHKLKLAKAHRKTDDGLPMYIVLVKARPEHYTSTGYAVVNHPRLKNKYFTSKKQTDAEKLEMALTYLSSV